MTKEYEFVVSGCAVKMVYEDGEPPQDPNIMMKGQADENPNKVVDVWWQMMSVNSEAADQEGNELPPEEKLLLVVELEDGANLVSWDEGKTWGSP